LYHSIIFFAKIVILSEIANGERGTFKLIGSDLKTELSRDFLKSNSIIAFTKVPYFFGKNSTL